MVRAALILLAGAAPALADPAVMGSLAGDLDGDGRAELAVLIGESDLSLAIFTQPVAHGPMRLAAEGPGLAWMGSLAEPPSMEITPSGSLRVTSSNWGIGRNKWEMTLTIAHRDGAYRMAGVTFNEIDTLDLDAGRGCDVNLLSGKGLLTFTAEGRPDRQIRAGLGPVPISQWTPDSIALACGPDW